jgi:hypothetical protein
MANAWIEFMKQFRARPENQGMTQPELMHYGGIEYRGATGGSLKSIVKKISKKGKAVKKVAQKGNQIYKDNQVLIDHAIGSENAEKLHKARSTVNNTVATVNNAVNDVHNGAGFNLKKATKKVRKVVKAGAKVYDNNQDLINSGVDDETAKLLSKARGILAQNGGKFNLKKALRKTKHTVHKVASIATPLALAVAPELTPALGAISLATGGSVGGCKGCIVGGSFRGPRSEGGAIGHKSKFIGIDSRNNYSPFVNGQMVRGKPPSLRNRAFSVN